MGKKTATILIALLLGFLIIGQSVYLTSQIDVKPVNEPMISSTTNVSDINAAHITEPTTVPIVQEYKTDLTPYIKKTIVYRPAPRACLFRFLPYVTESFGFLDVRKYQSNYLT